MENENNMIPGNEAEADALLDQVQDTDSQTITEAAPAPAATVDEYKFTVGGKEISAKRDQLIRWAQQGYDAPNKIGTLTKQLEGWKQKESNFKTMQEKYGPIDEYVRQNPKFWDHVVQQFQQKDQLLNDPSNPLAQTVSQLQSQMQDLVQYKNQVEQQRQAAQMQQEDTKYQEELSEIRKSYPTVDFNTPDENGKSLEYKVLEYANANGIKKFTTAFRDLHHDELKRMYEEGAKEKVSKERQKNTKLGILGVTPTPTRRTSEDVKGKSYNDLASEALAELGLT